MFSWICPRCGRDNPPSATACLSCGTRFDVEPEAPAVVDATPEPIAPAAAVVDQPSPSATRPARDLPPRPSPSDRKPAPRAGIPTWAVIILGFLAALGVGSALIYGIEYFSGRKQATTTGLDPAANVARTKLSNPLQKVVEVVGIRLVQDAKRKPEARFVVVNHSPNALDPLSATVTLWASTSRSEEDSVGTFTFKLPSLGAYSSKEVSAPLNTKLKFYELPDWQNATPDVQITSP